MKKSQLFAIAIAALTTTIALWLALDRSGVIAWLTLVGGISLLGKSFMRPGRFDPALAVALAVIPVVAWVVTFYSVIATWESGEVVELVIDTEAGSHTARVWVMDMDATPVIYYDAEPAVASALLAGKPVQFTRGGAVSTRIPDATPVAELPEVEANRILAAMTNKYSDRMSAADYYYVLLGRPTDRVAVVVRLGEA